MIDVNKPLELSDGTRVELVEKAFSAGWIHVKSDKEEWFFWDDGTIHSAWIKEGRGRTLRNVRPVLTGVECVERMEALVRRMAERAYDGGLAAEAREIVAMLPERTSPDLLEARRICSELCRFYAGNGTERPQWILDGKMDHDGDVQMVLAAIKAGRNA